MRCVRSTCRCVHSRPLKNLHTPVDFTIPVNLTISSMYSHHSNDTGIAPQCMTCHGFLPDNGKWPCSNKWVFRVQSMEGPLHLLRIPSEMGIVSPSPFPIRFKSGLHLPEIELFHLSAAMPTDRGLNQLCIPHAK